MKRSIDFFQIKRMLESKSRDFLINLIIDQIDELDFCSV